MYEIYKISSEEPVDFAAMELQKYLRMMMPRCGSVPIKYAPDRKSGIRLGLMQDFGLDTSEAEDIALDDIIHLENDGSGQIIAGSNPRSVLLAVYKFLKLNGCRWLFPGVDGESIPMREIEYVDYHKMADLRYRGQCNEGSTAQINYLDAIDFVPKIGMNIYMLEFDVPIGYYREWYDHKYNPSLTKEPITEEQVLQWKRQCEFEIKKRGLEFHDIGHGWTTNAFGLAGRSTWFSEDLEMPPEIAPNIAEVNGKREFHHGITLHTNICMSRRSARAKMIECVCDYAEKHDYVDFLHVWLADGEDNHCECEDCRKMIPSDWYMILLNELDEEMTRRHIPTRIVFIAYFDTLYAPLSQKLKNKDRFAFLFAPNTRNYVESFLVDADHSDTVPYNRNHNTVPKSVGGNMAYLEDWHKVFDGETFLYEYHFWRPHTFDPSYQHIAHNLYDDIHGMRKHHIKGIIEDQTPRNYMPSGFAQTLYGEALFDLSLSFEEIEQDYMQHAFGEDWRLVKGFLDSLENSTVLNAIHRPPLGENGKYNYSRPELVPVLEKWLESCEKFIPVIDAHQNIPVRAQSVLWKNLYFFIDLVRLDARIMKARFSGNDREA